MQDGEVQQVTQEDVGSLEQVLGEGTEGSFSVPVLANPYDEAKEFGKIAKGSLFLPRLQLFGSSSDLVKEEKVQIGYAIVRGQDDMTELGRNIDVMVLNWRPKALDTKAFDDKGKPAIISSFKVGSEEFNAIQRKSAIKNSGAMFGPEFLIYVAATGEFCTFFMGSPTARREAPVVKGYIATEENRAKGKGKVLCTLTTHLFSNKEFKWHGTRVLDCTTPPSTVPTTDEMADQQKVFLNPPVRAVQEATDEELAAAGAERAV